jgi:hypothetical protein
MRQVPEQFKLGLHRCRISGRKRTLLWGGVEIFNLYTRSLPESCSVSIDQSVSHSSVLWTRAGTLRVRSCNHAFPLCSSVP